MVNLPNEKDPSLANSQTTTIATTYYVHIIMYKFTESLLMTTRYWNILKTVQSQTY